jgi:hypothetical protein
VSTEPIPIPLAEFAPDRSTFDPASTNVISNAIPNAGGYGPMRKWVEIASTLPARCRGAISVRKSDGGTSNYAGTATRLYKFNPATLAWDNVTRVSGGDYSCGEGVDWSFTQFGSRLVATNGSDANQYIDISAGSNFAALTNSPKAFYCTTVGDFLVMGCLASDANAVAWSEVNNSEGWTPGYGGSDQQTFPEGGRVRGVVPYRGGFVVLQDDKLQVAVRSRNEYVFSFPETPLPNLGCFAPYSIVYTRDNFFWLSQEGFHMGIEAKPIGTERVDEHLATMSGSKARRNIRSCYDPARKIMWWLYEMANGKKRMLGYKWTLDKWTEVDVDMDYIFPAIPPGITVDGLDSFAATVDELVYAVDSPFYEGTGLSSLAAFNSAGVFGYFEGPNLPATFETCDFNLKSGGLAFTNRFRLTSNAPHSLVTGTVGSKASFGSATQFLPEVAANSVNGFISRRKNGGTLRWRAKIAEGDWGHANQIVANVRSGGGR